jgi:predicted TIM-barrel fold metal-dependent hydrolase
MVAALARENDRFKGIAAVPPDVSTAELNRLVDARVVGVRFNILDYEPRSLADHTMAPLLEKLQELNLCVQLHASGDLLARSARQLVERNIRCVIDHCGRPDVRLGVEHPAFRSLLELGGSEALFVKLSGPFRVSLESDPYADLDAYYAALIGAFTLERCVWGSDWPFLGIDPRPEYERILNGLDRWVPNACDRRLVLWDTPARLFGFT